LRTGKVIEPVERPMGTASQLERGRESFDRGAWAQAYAEFAAADRESALAPDDLERLAAAAYLTGRDSHGDEVWARAHHEWLRAGNPARAARCAFRLAFDLLMRGEEARSGGWLGRAQRLIDEGGLDCAERGYVLLPAALERLDVEPVTGYAIFAEIGEIGDRFVEPDLITLGRLGRGQALIRAGRTTEGVALLDEAMVAVTADEVSVWVAGIVYCAVILECQSVFDLRRAHEWTVALTHWCDSQPDLVPYRGQCLVHRAELMQLHGEWPDALDEARRACRRLAGDPAAAEAHYELAELHRLRGEFAAAEEAYREASRLGKVPQPGLALLRLMQGRVDTAAAAMRTAMDAAPDRITRSHLLSAHVEVMLAAGDLPAARTAADELDVIARELATPFTLAVSAHAAGAVRLAESDGASALLALRRAWTAWQEVDAPYQAARARVLMGLACRSLDDHDGATLELDAARWVFHQLGAAPDVSRVEKLSLVGPPGAAARLTARELEVLRLVAAGKTNRAIAADLVLSDKTVARHVSNIFTKLDLTSRSAATAYAYENGLV
jgi:DNA-binding CsgD family transcriptional regulator/tetratricopeptide (TPR) repeat protein